MNIKNNIIILRTLILISLLGLTVSGNSEPSPGKTTYIGPFTGPGATLHPDNLTPYRIRYYGTDLGFSYQHEGQLYFLFGDTMATEEGEAIEASTGDTLDDSYGTVALADWPDPAMITAGNIPLIKLGQNPGTVETSRF